jgi:hypothetical protein
MQRGRRWLVGLNHVPDVSSVAIIGDIIKGLESEWRRRDQVTAVDTLGP